MGKSIFIFRHAALYRQSIYQLIDKEFNPTFCFAKSPVTDLKLMDYTCLNDVKFDLIDMHFPFGFYFLKGMLKLPLNNYQNVVFAGDVRDISSWLLLVKCKLSKKKTFLWTHGWYGKENCLIKIAKKIYYRLADNVILYGSYAKDLMMKEGFSSEKLHVIYNSLDYNSDVKKREALKKTSVYKEIFKNNAPVLLFVGRLTVVKRLELLLEAQKHLNNSGLLVNVILIGEGEERQTLQSIVSKNNLQKFVHFFGESYDNEKLSELIFNADLCISPGNVGLTAIHSLSFGTPVITHNNFELQMPEFESISKGKSGDFFEYNSSISLANTIKEWLIMYPVKTDELVRDCFTEIDNKYNPNKQLELLRKLLVDNVI